MLAPLICFSFSQMKHGILLLPDDKLTEKIPIRFMLFFFVDFHTQCFPHPNGNSKFFPLFFLLLFNHDAVTSGLGSKVMIGSH